MAYFLKHFAQGDHSRAMSGLVRIAGDMSAQERFLSILRQRVLYGTNGKGYFHRSQTMPASVSFSAKVLESLDRFYTQRSAYALVFDINRIKPGFARPVAYLSEQQIKEGHFFAQDKWLVDLVRPKHVWELDEMTGESRFVRKYDFSWQEEWRIKGTSITFGYDKVAFVIVPRREVESQVRGEFPVETLLAKDNYARVVDFRNAHGGQNPPLEQTVVAVQSELVKSGRVSDPAHGVYLLPEIVEQAWQRLGFS